MCGYKHVCNQPTGKFNKAVKEISLDQMEGSAMFTT